MGVLVFALAIMDNNKNSHLEVMKAEVPGPVFGKIVSKLKNTAQILYYLYLALFFLFVVIYFCAGMPLYDSFIIAMWVHRLQRRDCPLPFDSHHLFGQLWCLGIWG